MLIRAAAEYNVGGCLLYAADYAGAYARGRTPDEASPKLPEEVRRYCRWSGDTPDEAGEDRVIIVQSRESALHICDADSDIILDGELPPLTEGEYLRLKGLALKSAGDFLKLYASVPDKDATVLKPRETFYGPVPLTAREMYEHTRDVNSYYFGEIGVDAGNGPDILEARRLGFEELERHPGYLENAVYRGSWGESWSLRKLCRRFIWHDRIHARAIYRMASRLCGEENIANPFGF